MTGFGARTVARLVAGALGLAAPLTALAADPVSSWDNYPPGSGIKTSGGVISSTGTVLHGSGFTISKNGTGQYTIDYPGGSFPSHAPAFSCTALGSAGGQTLCRIETQNWNKLTDTTVGVHIIDLSGALQDNAWEFTEVTTK